MTTHDTTAPSDQDEQDLIEIAFKASWGNQDSGEMIWEILQEDRIRGRPNAEAEYRYKQCEFILTAIRPILESRAAEALAQRDTEIASLVSRQEGLVNIVDQQVDRIMEQAKEIHEFKASRDRFRVAIRRYEEVIQEYEPNPYTDEEICEVYGLFPSDLDDLNDAAPEGAG